MKRTKELRNNKGITMVSLILTIVLMIIISSVTIHTSLDRFEINKYNKMANDIELLEDKVNNYYLKYNGLPILRDKQNNPYTYSTIDFNKNSNDNDNYYILDLKAMEGISLNYGKEGFENPNTSDDVYIINEKSLTIYYVRGIKVQDVMHYTIQNNKEIEDTIPPSKPGINIISGTLNHDGTYITEVEFEIVPGKVQGKLADKTEYSIDGGTTWEDIATSEKLTNNIYKITADGTYNIHVRSYDDKENISDEYETKITTAILRIGDKVEYNEGTGYTSDIDTNFVMKDMKWRILDIEEDGTIELISTQPTDSLYYLPKTQEAWLEYEEKLDQLCDDIYGKGIGANKARSLKVEDINKIMANDFEPTYYSSLYGKYFWYKFDSTSETIQYSKDYNEETKMGTWEDTGYTSFKDPRENIIDSKNYLDEKGQLRIAKTQHNFIYYDIEEVDLTKLRTRDGILMSQLITQGLDNSNTSASGTTQKQWLSSKYIDCTQKYVEYGAFRVGYGAVSNRWLWRSNGESLSGDYYYVVRPVVVLNANTEFTFVNEQWQINE